MWSVVLIVAVSIIILVDEVASFFNFLYHKLKNGKTS